MAAALVLLDPCMLGAQERGAIDWGHLQIMRQARDMALQEADEAAADEREAEEAAAVFEAGRAAVEMWL
eukprot:6306738-Heterocapsa_arctica.AAC.1